MAVPQMIEEACRETSRQEQKPRFDKQSFEKPSFDKPSFDKPRFEKFPAPRRCAPASLAQALAGPSRRQPAASDRQSQHQLSAVAAAVGIAALSLRPQR